jgi:hypothetical protein
MATEDNRGVQKRTRRIFAFWGIAYVLSLIVAFNPFRSSSKKPKDNPDPDKVKMLSQDGQLIEVDAVIFAAIQKKNISDKELQEWIRK